jgi:hypothetical protein
VSEERDAAALGALSARRRAALRWVLGDGERFARYLLGRQLRPYQVAPLRAILASVLGRQGLTFTVMYARQMGKNELSAVLECYLLTLCAGRGGTLVKAAPTWRPQVVTSVVRLEGLLEANPLTRGRWRARYGYMREVGQARALFFSGAPGAQVVGATASLLLEIDEAQDFDAERYEKAFRPMGAAGNVTTVLYGTAWDGQTVLEREAARNVALEAADGVRRHFGYDWRHGAAVNAAYEAYVEGERARLGAAHPLFRTQYALEAVAGTGRLFGPGHLAQLRGSHSRERRPVAGVEYVAGLDVAGEEEASLATGAFEPYAKRDSAVLTIARVVEQAGAVPGVAEPGLEVVEQYAWTGRKHRELIPQVVDLLRNVWRVRQVVVDATGVGGAVASYLVGALGARCRPFVFTAASKSALAYGLLAAVNAGRVRMYAEDGSVESAEFWRQCALARYEVRAHEALWFGVDAREGHDDFVMSLALVVEAVRVAPVRRARAVGPRQAGDAAEGER